MTNNSKPTGEERPRDPVAGPTKRDPVDVGGSSAVGWIGWGLTGYPGLWRTPHDTARVRHDYNPLDALKRKD